MEGKKNNLEEQQTQQQYAAPADNEGKQQGKTFTQDDVNRIVSERLERERAKSETTAQALRDQELTERENRLACREYIVENKYPEVLLDVFPTADADAFKASVANLEKAFPHVFQSELQTTGMTLSTGGEHGTGLSAGPSIADAFKRKGL